MANYIQLYHANILPCRNYLLEMLVVFRLHSIVIGCIYILLLYIHIYQSDRRKMKIDKNVYVSNVQIDNICLKNEIAIQYYKLSLNFRDEEDDGPVIKEVSISNHDGGGGVDDDETLQDKEIAQIDVRYDVLDGQPMLKSDKEKECWALFKKMTAKGVSVTFDTVLRFGLCRILFESIFYMVEWQIII